MLPEAHGGVDPLELRELGIDPASVVDFSVNVNPYGPAPRALAALRRFDPAAYPDRRVLRLRETLAEANGVPLAEVLAGNGAAELIWLAAHAFLRPGDTALVVGPTFGEYERAARAVGARVACLRAAAPGFQLSAAQIVAEVRAQRPRLVFLCNPNNPTGLLLPEAGVAAIAAACAGGILVLDEAYRSFTAAAPFAPAPAPGVVVLRSMTKDFALAGLRLAYALGPPDLLEAMRACQPPWSVSGAAQAAGLAALKHRAHLARTLAQTRQAAAELRAGLTGLGARIVPASVHFLLIEVGSGAAVRSRLLGRGCLVRDCASFGLPEYVRVGTRTPPENARLIIAWPALGG
jgi:histidinol-phosphate aminotransferase